MTSYTVAEIGRLTLSNHDIVTVAAVCPCDDDELYSLNRPAERRELLLRHGHAAADIVSYWRYGSEIEATEQREAARELFADYHNSRGVMTG